MVGANPPAKGRRRLFLVLGSVLALSVVLAAAGAGYVLFLRPGAAPRPVVTIRRPGHGEKVRVGEPVVLHSVAEGESPIVRIELWADGELQGAESASEPDRTPPTLLRATWRPPTPGAHTLTARAFDARGGRAQASITVEAEAEPDGDGDGSPDARDACPDQAGSFSAGGCPDGDGDGVPDADDACPGEAGPAEGDGCPAPAAGDRDGDGVPDEADLAADEPGPPSAGGRPDADGDGVPDADDACPGEPGEGDDGCAASADRDDDGVRDVDDACPEEWGLPASDGCPDADGDGVADGRDLCPGEPGPPERAGCPESDAGDSDGDGVTDDHDLAPEEPGRPEDGGAPPPGEGEDRDGDGRPDAEEAPEEIPLPRAFPLPAPPVPVELQVLSLEVSHDYHGLYLYPSLVGAEAERYTLEPLGERQWDVPAELGSRMLLVPDGEPLELQMEVGGDLAYAEGGGAWGAYFDLGDVVASHPPSYWDGRVFSRRSSGGDGGRWFQVRYRLCAVSCEEAAWPPPELFTYTFASDRRLVWRWDGDRAQLEGYRLWMDGNLIQDLPADAPTDVSVSHLAASCGRARRFYVTAYGGPAVQSPRSNEVVLESPPCPRVVRVTFESIDTGQLGDDEWWAHGESVGPIHGNFWAQGTSMEVLAFRTVRQDRPGGRLHGYRLSHNTHYAVQDIFEQIWTWIGGSMSSPYSAPDCNYVDVELDAYQTLVIGGSIKDADGDGDDILFDYWRRIPSTELAPGRYTVRDRNITLTVLVDIIVGPEAGDRPDLTITDVTQEPTSGQLRIHIFNGAANLNDQDIDVNIVRASTNEPIALETWHDVSIPSGGSRILQSPELVMEPYDLRVIIDPDNRINEMDERNNIYETTVVMRVEFLEVSNQPCDCTPYFCNEPGCIGEVCDSEHVFWVWAGHGHSPDDLLWTAQRVRFPESGELMAYYFIPDDENWLRTWRMEGNPRYTFDVEVPAGENLYIQVGGVEQDSITQDDSMGQVFAGYAPHQNWGARAEPYDDAFGHDSSCDDVNCHVCEGGMWAQWRITRVH